MKNQKLWLIPVITLAIGIFLMPYGYYNFLRVVIFLCSLFLAYKLYKLKDYGFAAFFCFFVILYNPFFPVYLYEKSLWMIINLITALAFYYKKDNFKFE